MDILLGPNVNIHRDPLGGRIFESYGEDPYLASRMAVDYIQGVQSTGVAADVKHFAANNQETMRQGIDARISERALREIYLPAFKAAVQEGGCWTVMSAYNKINGVDCALNHRLLTEILRDEWGFDGFVVSDWGAAYDRIAALKAGNDLEMPGPQDAQVIVDAVRRGELDEAVLDARIANILGVLIKLPAFTGRTQEPLNRAASLAMAKAIAVNGAVLLKNEGDALPLAADRPVAVLGDNAVQPIPTGGGSAGVESPYTVSLLEGLQARLGEARVALGRIPADAAAAIVSVGVPSAEGTDRETLALPAGDVALIRETAAACKKQGIPCVAVLNVCGPVEMAAWIDEVDAVLLIWLGGMELGHAAAALLVGDENPSGKLPTTFPKRYADTPTALNFPGDGHQVAYAEDIYVGYRYYDAKELAPLFPFGYGLSYTRFELSNLRLGAATFDLDAAGETLAVSVDVTNVGARAGQEVVQLYLSDVEANLPVPAKQLKGFAKVALTPGETRTVTLTLDREALQYYDPYPAMWCAEPGVFRVLVGTSAEDIRLTAEFQAVGRDPYGFGPDTPISKLVSDARAVAVLQRHLPAALTSPEALQVSLQYFPHQSFEKTWAMRIAPALFGQTAAEKDALLERIYADLAEI
jgi:beta-glucosidase